MTLASIPSPTTAVWDVGPVPVRAYALFIVAGIIVACVVTELRLRGRGTPRYAVLDLAVWAVPFGIVGGRLYHVITTPDKYFGEGGDLAAVVRVWEGGLGIWGAIAGGAVGVWLACRQMQIPFRMVADAAAVGIPLAQAVGRLGNWFNNELYGVRDDGLPWGLEVHNMDEGRAEPLPDGGTLLEGLYHPTFLYELLWNVGVAILVWQLGRRLGLGRGRQFALYVMGYTAGRFWIEMLRIDDTAEVTGLRTDTVVTILGQRLNVWVSLLVFLAALVYFLRVRGPQEFLVPAEDGEGLRVGTAEEYRQHRSAAAEGGPEDSSAASPVGTLTAEADDGVPATAEPPAAGGTGEPGQEPTQAAEPAGEAEPTESTDTTRTSRDDDT